MNKPLVIINGWGGTEELLQPLQSCLSKLPFSSVSSLDLPGFGRSAAIETDDPLAWLAANLPDDCCVVGWSLGGQLAAALQAKQPARFAGLFMVASNPQFVASRQWPGMAAEVFANFSQSFAAQPQRTWQKFLSLCVSGDADLTARELLAAWPLPANLAQAGRALQWLATIYSHNTQASYLLAEHDALVPVALAQKLCNVRLVAGSHLLPYRQPQVVAAWLAQCLQADEVARAR